MSFDSRSELPPHLLALANLTQWHANASSHPLDVRFRVTHATVETISTAVTGAFGTQPPADYTRAITVAAYELAQGGHFRGSFDVRINATPGGQVIVKQIPVTGEPAETAQEETPAETAAPVSHNGLQLRSALLARGHSAGYSPAEIAAEEKERGFTFTPELKFYRALVREGVVAERGNQQVFASAAQADFGAATIDSVPWRAPETTDGTVQAVLNHNLWIEIANDSEHLYAIDLAPGAAGVPGQVLARRRAEASVPVRIALSLAQFVTGDFTDSQDAAPTPATPAQGAGGKALLEQTLVWAGAVEALALPGFLGWTLAPGQKRYEAVMGVIDPAQLAAAKEPVGSAEPANAPVQAGTPATQAGAPAVQESEAPLTGAGAPGAGEGAEASAEPGAREVTPAPAAPVVLASASAQKSATLFTSAETGANAEPVQSEAPVLTVQDVENTPVPELPHPAEAVSAEPTEAEPTGDLDLEVKAPVSKEQQEIATSMATLAFGTKEERQGFVAPDTGLMPTIASRAKKVSLVDPVEKTPEPEEPSALRSALRKFFLG